MAAIPGREKIKPVSIRVAFLAEYRIIVYLCHADLPVGIVSVTYVDKDVT